MPVNPEKWSKNYLYKHKMLVIKNNARKIDTETGLPSIIKLVDVGGTRCFDKEQLVITDNGSKRICDISISV
jgi:hypothetical protein